MQRKANNNKMSYSCRGVCKTGYMCERSHWLDAAGYCRDHKNQKEDWEEPKPIPANREHKNRIKRLKKSTNTPMDFEWSSRQVEDSLEAQIARTVELDAAMARSIQATMELDVVISNAMTRATQLDETIARTLQRTFDLEEEYNKFFNN